MSARRGPRHARVTVLLCGLLCGLLAGACPGVRAPLEHARVDVSEVAAQVNAEGHGKVRVRLRVMNRNAIALSARAVDWELAVTGVGPRRGRAALDQIIAARSTAMVDVELDVPGLIMANQAAHSRDYRLSGTLHLMSERGDVGAVFDSQGEL